MWWKSGKGKERKEEVEKEIRALIRKERRGTAEKERQQTRGRTKEQFANFSLISSLDAAYILASMMLQHTHTRSAGFRNVLFGGLVSVVHLGSMHACHNLSLR